MRERKLSQKAHRTRWQQAVTFTAHRYRSTPIAA